MMFAPRFKSISSSTSFSSSSSNSSSSSEEASSSYQTTTTATPFVVTSELEDALKQPASTTTNQGKQLLRLQESTLSDHQGDDDGDDDDVHAELESGAEAQQPQQVKVQPVWKKMIAAAAGIAIGATVLSFSLEFPFWLAPAAARATYYVAAWRYDESLSHFDNTAFTYGTDYGLAVVMVFLAFQIPVLFTVQSSEGGTGKPLQPHALRSDIQLVVPVQILARRSRALLLSYAMSVTAGGLAHQFYFTVADRNTWQFRLLWTICVGSVAAAAGFMGAIGTALMRVEEFLWSCNNNSHGKQSDKFDDMRKPRFSACWNWMAFSWFWIGFTVVTTGAVAAGWLSFQRPACDIFFAGITQCPSTFYMMALLALQPGALATHLPLSSRIRQAGMVAFILNAPLLPMYPLLIQYTNWSLAAVNTLLHSWLCVAWGLQGWTLQQVVLRAAWQAARLTQPPPPVCTAAIPIKATTKSLKKTL